MSVKIGVSIYCYSNAITSGQLSVAESIREVARIGGEHVEIVPSGFELSQTPGLIGDIVKTAADVGIDVSNYAIGADFLTESAADYEREIDRVKREVDIAAQLGVSRMRHDITTSKAQSVQQFLSDLPRFADACGRIADYAAQYGITTSVENHGYYVQASERILMLIDAVSRPNFKTTLDIGNFWCVDEDPLVGLTNNLPNASIVHIKDFYRRSPRYKLGNSGWFRSGGGYHLRGAIVGHGDLDVEAVFAKIRTSGYEGYLTIEFEGMEECVSATELALANARQLWRSAADGTAGI